LFHAGGWTDGWIDMFANLRAHLRHKRTSVNSKTTKKYILKLLSFSYTEFIISYLEFFK